MINKGNKKRFNQFHSVTTDIEPVTGMSVESAVISSRSLDQRSGARIVLYSHDTMGLGHIRRNLLIAQTLSTGSLRPDILLVSGTQEAGLFKMPKGVDCLILPSLYKNSKGEYISKRLRMGMSKLIEIRSRILRTTIAAFSPDLLVVDNVARGAAGELEQTLRYLKSSGYTRCVLGMRDILDDPAIIMSDPARSANIDFMRNYYDEIWVYGDPAIYNPVREYRYPADVAMKAYYTGYLDQRERLKFVTRESEDYHLNNLGILDAPYILCTVGGGQDGDRLVEIFSQSVLPEGLNGIVLTGPHMKPEVKEKLYLRTALNKRIKILNFVPEPAVLMKHANCVVAMGGYNTLGEILSFEKRALIVPRITPRTEQLLRARRLNDLGLVEMLHPDDLNVESLSSWMGQQTHYADAEVHGKIDINGLAKFCMFTERILAVPHNRRYAPQGAFQMRQDQLGALREGPDLSAGG